MIKVSEFLGKRLISLADAKTVGCVCNVWFDSRLRYAKTIEVLSDEDEFPERTFIELRNVTCGNDAAVIKHSVYANTYNLASATITGIINKNCYNQSGTYLGKVTDVILNNRNVEKIVCENGEFTPKQLLSISRDIIIFNDSGKPIKLYKPKVPAPLDSKVINAEVSLHRQERVQTPTAPVNVTVTRTPGDPVKDYSFLMGKSVRSPIISGGKVLIPQGTTVTQATIDLARKENKLVQLALRAY